MIKQFETALFFAATVSALALAAVVGMQEFSSWAGCSASGCHADDSDGKSRG